MEFSKQIATLKESLAAALAEASTAKAENATIVAAREALQAQLTEALGKVTQLEADAAEFAAKITKLEADHTAAIEKINGETETKIRDEVNNRCAAAGVEPIKRTPEGPHGDTKGAPAAGLKGMDKARAALKARHEAGYARTAA